MIILNEYFTLVSKYHGVCEVILMLNPLAYSMIIFVVLANIRHKISEMKFRYICLILHEKSNVFGSLARKRTGDLVSERLAPDL